MPYQLSEHTIIDTSQFRSYYCIFIAVACIIFLMQDSPVIAGSKVMLETVGNTQTRQLYIDGFDKLSSNDKIFAYYVTQAGLAGRDIYYDQNYINALKIRNLFEELSLDADYLDSELRRDVRSYLHRFWINSCQYDHFSRKKFVPDFTAENLITRFKTKNRKFNTLTIDNLIGQISDLQKDIFDSTYFPLLTIKHSGTEVDIIQQSANNLYHGVSSDEIYAWEQAGLEKYPSNSRVIKHENAIVEMVYRIGDADAELPPGLYADQLKSVVHYLDKAYEYASPEQQLMIENLIRFYVTGDQYYMNQSIVHWLANESEVDFLQGFIQSMPVG